MKQSTPISTATPKYSSLQISATPRGRVVPIIYGAHKVTSDIVWSADFHNVSYTQNTGSSSGKSFGGGGGKNGQGQAQFYYFAAMLGTLCEGPIYCFTAARNGAQWIYFNGNAPAQSWPVTSAVTGISLGSLPYEGFPLDQYLGVSPDLYVNLLPWEVVTSQNYLPFEEQGMVDQNNSVNPSKNNGFTQQGTTWQNIGSNSWGSQAFMLMPGLQGQSYPPYIGTHYPSQIDTYQYTAYWFSPAYQLGQSATPPSIDWWIVGLLPYDPTGALTGIQICDAEPSSVIVDLVTNPVRGLGVSVAHLDPVTFGSYKTYCVAGGLFLAMNLTSQIELTQIINQIETQTVATSFWSEGLLKIVPWYDQSITGYGKTFTPNITPVYYINDNHWLDQKGKGPLEVQRSSVFDCYNQMAMNFTNRASNYSTDTITVDDQGNQQIWGVRPAPPAMAQYIADQSVAAASAQLQLYKQMYSRNTYTFSLPYIFGLLEPMDIVVLTDVGLGVINFPVRILTLSLSDKDEYTVTAQDLRDEIYSVAARNQQASSGQGLGLNVPPGSIEAPFIFTAPTAITRRDLEIWIAVAGVQSTWGGCNIWMSTDGVNYEKVGTQWVGSRYGVLRAPLAPYGGTNPDNIHTLNPNTIGSHQTLSSVTPSQAAQELTLGVIRTGTNYELLSYTTATLVGTAANSNAYTLSGLYRGLNGTFATQHNYGDLWARLDGNIVKIPIHLSQLYRTVYFKFPSFNSLGGMVESLSNCVAYPFTITPGISSPVGPTNIVVGTDGKFVILTWQSDPSLEVIGYQIRYGQIGGNFQQAKPIINAISSSHSISLIMPPGTWNFYVASFDAHGNFTSGQVVQFTVPILQVLFGETNFGQPVHPLDPIAVLKEDWGGTNATYSGTSVHPTYYGLVPIDSTLASFSGSDNGWEWVDQFCVTPPATLSYTSPVVNIGAGATNVRGSAHLYEFLWGLGNIPSTGLQTVTVLNPDWSVAGLVLTGCYAHPTAWVIVPTDSLAASFSGADNGWEMFDFPVYSPPPTSTVTYTAAPATAALPIQATMITSLQALPGQASPAVTGAINSSGDGVHWVTRVTTSGAGQASATAVDQYFQFVVTLTNASGAIGTLNSMIAETLVGPPSYWTSVVPMLRTSADGTTWGSWQQIPSAFTNQQYLQFMMTWTLNGAIWPFGIESLWLLTDGSPITQTGTVTTAAGTASVVFTIPFRQIPVVTASTSSGSSIVVVVVSQSATGFIVDTFTSSTGTAAPIVNVNWSATGI